MFKRILVTAVVLVLLGASVAEASMTKKEYLYKNCEAALIVEGSLAEIKLAIDNINSGGYVTSQNFTDLNAKIDLMDKVIVKIQELCKSNAYDSDRNVKLTRWALSRAAGHARMTLDELMQAYNETDPQALDILDWDHSITMAEMHKDLKTAKKYASLSCPSVLNLNWNYVSSY